MGVPAESIESGNYGSPPRTWWWFKQSMIYFVGLMGMKFCVLIIFLALPIISRVGDWALSWTDGNEALQVVFVMLIFPVIMNATQYYIIDSFIKKQNHDEMQVLPQEDADEDDHSCDEHPVRRASEDAAVKKLDLGTQIAVTDVDAIKSPLRRGAGDYDPLRDGESSPLVLASSEPIDEPKDLIGENSNSAESDR